MNTKQSFEKQTLIEQILLPVGVISIGLGSLFAFFNFFYMNLSRGGPLLEMIYRFPVTAIAVALLGLSLIALSEVIKQIRLSNLQHYTQNPSHESSKKSSG